MAFNLKTNAFSVLASWARNNSAHETFYSSFYKSSLFYV